MGGSSSKAALAGLTTAGASLAESRHPYAPSVSAPIDAVIFDCDGTLVDSETLANEVLVTFIAEFGFALDLGDALERYRGCRMAECVADLEHRMGRALPRDFVPRLRARTADFFEMNLKPIEGAIETVRGLRLPYCVASSAPREKTESSLRVVGLLPDFRDRIFSSYEVGSWKPDPGLFLHAAAALGVDPRRCAVVEDSLPGIRAGLAAGMATFAFDPHGRLSFTMPSLGSAVRLRRLTDLLPLVAGP